MQSNSAYAELFNMINFVQYLCVLCGKIINLNNLYTINVIEPKLNINNFKIMIKKIFLFKKYLLILQSQNPKNKKYGKNYYDRH